MESPIAADPSKNSLHPLPMEGERGQRGAAPPPIRFVPFRWKDREAEDGAVAVPYGSSIILDIISLLHKNLKQFACTFERPNAFPESLENIEF